jgi:hypothetical protein
LFFKALRETMLALNVNPSLIDRYIAECGEVHYVINLGLKENSYLRTATSHAWYALDNHRDSLAVTMAALSRELPPYPGADRSEYYRPDEKFLSLLEQYGLPIRSGKAFEMTARLCLEGQDAVRKIRVSANITFEQLHNVLQKAFGWQNGPYYSFGLFKKWSEDPFAEPDVDLMMYLDNEYEIKPYTKISHNINLWQYLPKYKKIIYRYDIGDGWLHYIELDKVIEGCTDNLPLLLDGEGHAPLEDSSSPSEFSEFLRIFNDPTNKAHKSYKSRAKKQQWKPFEFDEVAEEVKRSHYFIKKRGPNWRKSS